MSWIIGALLGLLLAQRDRVEELKVENYRLQLATDLAVGVARGLLEELDMTDDGGIVHNCVDGDHTNCRRPQPIIPDLFPDFGPDGPTGELD